MHDACVEREQHSRFERVSRAADVDLDGALKDVNRHRTACAMFMQPVAGVQADQTDAQRSILDQCSPYPGLHLRQLLANAFHFVGKNEGQRCTRDSVLDW